MEYPIIPPSEKTAQPPTEATLSGAHERNLLHKLPEENPENEIQFISKQLNELTQQPTTNDKQVTQVLHKLDQSKDLIDILSKEKVLFRNGNEFNVNSSIILAAVLQDINPITNMPFQSNTERIQFAKEFAEEPREIYADRNRPANPAYAHQNLIIPNGTPEDLAEVYKKYLEIRYHLTPEQVTRLWTAVVPNPNDDNSLYYQTIDNLTSNTVSLARSALFTEEPGKKKIGVYRKGRLLKIPDESGKLIDVAVGESSSHNGDYVRVGSDRMPNEQIEIPRTLIDKYNRPTFLDYAARLQDATYDAVTTVKALPWVVLSLGQIHPDISNGKIIWIANRHAPISVHPRQRSSEKSVRNKYEMLYEAVQKKGYRRITQATLFKYLPEDKRNQEKTRATWDELSKGDDPLLPPLQKGQPNLEFDLMVPTVYFGPLSDGKMVVMDHHRRLAASALGMPIEITLSRDDDDYTSV